MDPIFTPRTSAYLKLGLLGFVGLSVLVTVLLVQFNVTNWATSENRYVTQPVPFSHEHHVGGLGIDCRYCHQSVEESSFAGMPSTHTCMSCHSQLYTEEEMLRPVRMSYQLNEPIEWNRVYNLPDYVYFNHSIHVQNGVGCESCHGRVDRMPLLYQTVSLHMAFCLECHRQPEQFVRPMQYIYAFGYDLPDKEQRALGRTLVEKYDIDVGGLDDCSVCHR